MRGTTLTDGESKRTRELRNSVEARVIVADALRGNWQVQSEALLSSVERFTTRRNASEQSICVLLDEQGARDKVAMRASITLWRSGNPDMNRRKSTTATNSVLAIPTKFDNSG